MKVIFVDIDGVLNSVDSIIACKHSNDWTKREESLDPVSIGLLERLCKETDAKIVISSTWRKLYSQLEFIDIFSKFGWVDFPMIGVTGSNSEIGKCRGHEIQKWLDEHPEVESYVILDDDSDMLDSQLDNFIHVSNVNGFRVKHYCRSLRIFGVPDERLEQQVNFVRKSDKGEHSGTI